VVPERLDGKGGSKGGSRAFQGAQLGAVNRKFPRFLGLRLALFESWSGSWGKKEKVGERRLTRAPRVSASQGEREGRGAGPKTSWAAGDG